ncbi:MAG: gamma-glutamyltransferase [candidate division Zixibacteria bacterium]|nr:gamma-glutamyltransferase [candidate division Zixibacteria bacterium]
MTSPDKRNNSDVESLDLNRPGMPVAQKLAVSRAGMVSTQHYLATEAGAEMLSSGGNAVDAAVASALALSVCEPAASGLGGQTMMLIHLAKNHRTFALDGSSRAPHRAIPGTLTEKDRRRGYRSATVPSTLKTLRYALGKYGRLKWAQVIEPAIRYAENGIIVSELQNRLLKRERKSLRQYSGGQVFLKEGRKTYKPGELFKQPALADTLKRISRRGVKTFYTGKLARIIQSDMIANGGLIRRDDLSQMGPPIERKPVSCWFGDTRVMTFPPPGAGRTLIEMLNIESHFPPGEVDPGNPEGALMIARIMQQAFRDRQDRPFEPNYYAQVSKKKMLSMEYAEKVARRIKTRGETTHLSVMDGEGNAVALTQSIERVYGSCAATPELGFLYNNYMMAFECDDISHPYYLRPNAIPWASVVPTIILKKRKAHLVIGSPGSERIAPTIFQILLRLRRQSPYEAVDAPRLYCNLEGIIHMEAARMRDDIPAYLEEKGFIIKNRDPYSFYLGCVQLIVKEKEMFIGVADPRRDCSAKGPAL